NVEFNSGRLLFNHCFVLVTCSPFNRTSGSGSPGCDASCETSGRERAARTLWLAKRTAINEHAMMPWTGRDKNELMGSRLGDRTRERNPRKRVCSFGGTSRILAMGAQAVSRECGGRDFLEKFRALDP